MGNRMAYLADSSSQKVQMYLHYMTKFSTTVPGVPNNFTQSTFQFEKSLAKVTRKNSSLKLSFLENILSKIAVSNTVQIDQ